MSIVGGLGRMVALEGIAAGLLFIAGRFAPEAKRRATAAVKTSIAGASPELAERIEQAEELERQALAQLSTGP